MVSDFFEAFFFHRTSNFEVLVSEISEAPFQLYLKVVSEISEPSFEVASEIFEAYFVATYYDCFRNFRSNFSAIR